MSSTRAKDLYNYQHENCKEMNVSVIDTYEATLLSGDWHYPEDGRHYRPDFNQVLLNRFYSKPQNNVTIDPKLLRSLLA